MHAFHALQPKVILQGTEGTSYKHILVDNIYLLRLQSNYVLALPYPFTLLNKVVLKIVSVSKG